MLEFALQFCEGVYTVIHSGRDEGEEDTRHLLEFLLAEEEFSWATVEGDAPYDEEKIFEHLLQRIEDAVRYIGLFLLQRHSKVLAHDYGRNVHDLAEALRQPFLRSTYDDAVILLQKNGYPNLAWGDDLKAEHEQCVVRAMNDRSHDTRTTTTTISDRPVFITRYPKEIKFFNMKVSADPRVVLSADLCLPISGESVGAAVREHDGIKLRDRLKTSTMFRLHEERGGTYEDFVWYVEDMVIAGKTPPHAGYGLGTSRLLQWLLGVQDIRQCSLFSLMAEHTNDFAVNRHGRARIITPPQRTILLSVADDVKEEIVTHLQSLIENDYVLYATSGTYRFLQTCNIPATEVFKISEAHQQPNITKLIVDKAFDIIVNIPSPENGAQNTDGECLRTLAIDTGTYLITDTLAAKHLLTNLGKQKNTRVNTHS
jgi:hypothetical protein